MKQVKGAACQGCPLLDDKYTLVLSRGPRNPQFIVMGEGPGQTEAARQQNFVGQSGKLLREALSKAGLDPDQGYYANASLCWPRNMLDKDEIMPKAVQACQGAMLGLLNCLPDVPVLAVGAYAQRALQVSTQDRWEIFQGKPVLATHHPARVLREPWRMFQFNRALTKFAGGPEQSWPPYQGTLPHTVNPYPLPDPNNWQNQRICIDVETDGGTDWKNPDNHIFMLGLAVRNERYIFTRDSLNQPETQAWLRAVMCQHGQGIGGHNFRFDVKMMAKDFGTPLVVGWDTINMVNCIHESWNKGLKELVTWFYNVDDYEHRLVKSHLAKLKRVVDRTYDRVPQDKMIEYLLNDIGYNLLMADDLEGLLWIRGRWEWPYQKHEIPQSNMLLQVEWDGFPVDLEQMHLEEDRMNKDIQMIEEQVIRMSDGVIQKPGSYVQVRKYLFDHLGRPVKHFTKKGAASTAEHVLLEHLDLPAIQALMYYRRVTKLRNSYLSNMFDKVHRDNQGVNRAHTTYKDWNVVTHRLSAENPPIQTLPHRDEKKDAMPQAVCEGIAELHGEVQFDGDYGTRIKKCYVARPGCCLITMDGMGWEVATATLQSHDEGLAEAFRKGESPHTAICDMLYGPGWTKAQKVKEKNVFFGWLYLGSVYALTMETGLPQADVQNVVNLLNKNLTKVKEWQQRMVANARRGRNPVPFFNYVNHFDLITPQTLRDVEKHAVNYINQGLGSMIMCRAAYRTQPKLRTFDARIVALVHDDFTVDVPDKYVSQVAYLMMTTLEKVGQEITDFIPLVGELSVGRNWGEMVPVSLQDLKDRPVQDIVGA